MKLSLKFILILMMLVGLGVNKPANSTLDPFKSCLHNEAEYLRIEPHQSCPEFHAMIGNSLAKHAGIDPDDCLLGEFIFGNDLN
jgi:hypothetical protein